MANQFRFTTQQYQTDAVNSLARVFAGQSSGQRKVLVGRSGTYVEEVFANRKLYISDNDIIK